MLVVVTFVLPLPFVKLAVLVANMLLVATMLLVVERSTVADFEGAS